MREKSVSARCVREIQAKGKTKERTKWCGPSKSQKEGEKKWHNCWCCQEQRRVPTIAQVSAEKLEHARFVEKERVALVLQREQLASTLELPLPKGKKNGAICPDHHITRWVSVKVSKSCTLMIESGIGVAAWGGKGALHSKGRQAPRRSRKKHEHVSGCESSLGGSAESWFHSSLAKLEMGKGVGRRRAYS